MMMEILYSLICFNESCNLSIDIEASLNTQELVLIVLHCSQRTLIFLFPVRCTLRLIESKYVIYMIQLLINKIESVPGIQL